MGLLFGNKYKFGDKGEELVYDAAGVLAGLGTLYTYSRINQPALVAAAKSSGKFVVKNAPKAAPVVAPAIWFGEKKQVEREKRQKLKDELGYSDKQAMAATYGSTAQQVGMDRLAHNIELSDIPLLGDPDAAADAAAVEMAGDTLGSADPFSGARAELDRYNAETKRMKQDARKAKKAGRMKEYQRLSDEVDRRNIRATKRYADITSKSKHLDKMDSEGAVSRQNSRARAQSRLAGSGRGKLRGKLPTKAMKLGFRAGAGMARGFTGDLIGTVAAKQLLKTEAAAEIMAQLPGVSEEEAKLYAGEYVDKIGNDSLSAVLIAAEAVNDLKERQREQGLLGDGHFAETEFVYKSVEDKYGAPVATVAAAPQLVIDSGQAAGAAVIGGGKKAASSTAGAVTGGVLATRRFLFGDD